VGREYAKIAPFARIQEYRQAVAWQKSKKASGIGLAGGKLRREFKKR
jgi:hypothetical protein